MAELAQRRKARVPHRNVVTKKMQEANTVLTEVANGATLDVDKLEGLRKTLREKLTYFKQLDRVIKELIEDDSEFKAFVKQSEDIVESINTAMAKISNRRCPCYLKEVRNSKQPLINYS
jgi:thiamine biosynthesis lipoprotein ApbE